MLPGIIAIVTVLIVGRWAKALPASFVGLVFGSIAFYILKFSLDGADVGTTMGELTTSLPVAPAAHFWSSVVAGGDNWAVVSLLIPAAISMAVVGSMETSLAITAIDQLSEERTNQSRELGAQGSANIVAALFGGLMATGGMVRTRPAYDMGARSVLSGVICSVALFVTMLSLAELIEFIPRSVVAGVVIVLGIQIFDRNSLRMLRDCCRRHVLSRTNTLTDVAVILTVIVTALVFDLIVAVIVGIIFSLIIFVARMSRSLIRRIVRGPAIHSRSAWDENSQKLIDENGHKIAIVELEGAVFFATADALEDRVRELIGDNVTHVVLDMKRVSQVDSSGVRALNQINRLLSRTGGKLLLSYVFEERRQRDERRKEKNREQLPKDRRHKSVERNLWRTFEETGVIASLGRDIFFNDTDSALVHCEREIVDQVSAEQRRNDTQTLTSPAIIEGLSPAEIKFLLRQCQRCFIESGDTIFREGERGDALYYLSHGRADVSIYLSELGQGKRLQTLLRGAIFGEMAILDDKPRAATVRAIDDTKCYRLSIESFELIKSEQPEIALKLFNNLCIMFSERMRSANSLISELEK